MKLTLPPKKCLSDAAHALCPGCSQPTQSTVRVGVTSWHMDCYRDPERVAAYRAQRRKDASV